MGVRLGPAYSNPYSTVPGNKSVGARMMANPTTTAKILGSAMRPITLNLIQLSYTYFI
jgi:hypothetical protein